ncbi:MAG: hypothetical protein MJ252_12900, partial [archaeon]|nr:hypothetical protein [archaeon]
MDKAKLDECIEKFISNILLKAPVLEDEEGLNSSENKEKKEDKYLTHADEIKEALICMALNGKLDKMKLRPILYKFFFGLFQMNEGIDKWIDKQINNYKNYEELKTKYLKEEALKLFRNKMDESLKESPVIEDETINLLTKDIPRTNQNIPLFKEKEIQEMLFNILFIYSEKEKENNPNESIIYKQGMSDLLAFLVLGTYPYYFSNEEADLNNKDILSQENKNSLLKGFLDINNKGTNETKEERKKVFLFFHNKIFFESDLFFLFSGLLSKCMGKIYESNQKYMIERAKKITHVMVKKFSPKLYEHFQEIKFNLEIVLERWLKCIFGREFEYKDTLKLWDVIFANEFIDEITLGVESNEFSFMDYLCMEMVVKYKDILKLKQEDECFGLLFHYPKVNTIFEIIRLADMCKMKDENEKNSKKEEIN